MESTPGALTLLTSDEQAFREAVRDFAENEIKPLVTKMDQDAKKYNIG